MKTAGLLRSKKVLLPLAVSLLFVAFLFKAIDWREAAQVFRMDMSPDLLFGFVLLAFMIVLLYGYRWSLLLDGQLSGKTLLIASLLCLGGNMFLPARGGDLLRVHYSHIVSNTSHATALSRLLIEKVIDLITIATLGALAVIWLNRSGTEISNYFSGVAITGLLATISAVVLLKYYRAFILRCLQRLFQYLGKSGRMERHIAHMITDLSDRLTWNLTLRPGALTMIMWLAVYVPSYMLIAHIVGVRLAYSEALAVLFAGALGLMIPAAPSGIGTFHASIVSAFLFLGRSAVEGLLVGTAIHLLFLIAYALPAALLCGVWHFNRRALQ